MLMHIVFDVRETKLIQAFKYLNERSENKTYSIQQLDVGDVHIYDNENLVCLVERKTWSDLSNSLIDNRYHEQKQRMMSTECSHRMYIIEGDSSCYNGLNRTILYSALIGAMIRDDILVFYTLDVNDTAFFVDTLTKKLEKIRNSDNSQKNVIPLQVSQNAKSSRYTKDNIWLAQLCCIPGLSLGLASKIAEMYPNYESLYEAYSQNERNCNFLTGVPKIGKVISQKVVEHMFK